MATSTLPADLPPEVSPYRRTPVFDQDSLPAALRREHSTKAGVWAVIHVLEGRLRYRTLEPPSETLLSPEQPGLIRPQQLHEVAPEGPVRFFVEFHAAEAPAPAPAPAPAEPMGQFASPPCFLHELDPAYGGVADPQQALDVKRWRKAERERLIAARLAIPARERRHLDEILTRTLDSLLPTVEGKIVSAYWPFRAEPDLRPWLESVAQRGGRAALPLVVQKGAPLVFRTWRQGEPLEPGIWNIPVPSQGPAVLPDVVIAPLVGFDAEGYRLGYGGGFFDRTLAAMPRRPLVIGIGYAQQRIATIFPQPYDIAMSVIVTEQGAVHAPAAPGPR